MRVITDTSLVDQLNDKLQMAKRTNAKVRCILLESTEASHLYHIFDRGNFATYHVSPEKQPKGTFMVYEQAFNTPFGIRHMRTHNCYHGVPVFIVPTDHIPVN